MSSQIRFNEGILKLTGSHFECRICNWRQANDNPLFQDTAGQHILDHHSDLDTIKALHSFQCQHCPQTGNRPKDIRAKNHQDLHDANKERNGVTFVCPDAGCTTLLNSSKERYLNDAKRKHELEHRKEDDYLTCRRLGMIICITCATDRRRVTLESVYMRTTASPIAVYRFFNSHQNCLRLCHHGLKISWLIQPGTHISELVDYMVGRSFSDEHIGTVTCSGPHCAGVRQSSGNRSHALDFYFAHDSHGRLTFRHSRKPDLHIDLETPDQAAQVMDYLDLATYHGTFSETDSLMRCKNCPWGAQEKSCRSFEEAEQFRKLHVGHDLECHRVHKDPLRIKGGPGSEHDHRLARYLLKPCNEFCHECTWRHRYYATMTCLGNNDGHHCYEQRRLNSRTEVYAFYHEHKLHGGEMMCHHYGKDSLHLEEKPPHLEQGLYDRDVVARKLHQYLTEHNKHHCDSCFHATYLDAKLCGPGRLFEGSPSHGLHSEMTCSGCGLQEECKSLKEATEFYNDHRRECKSGAVCKHKHKDALELNHAAEIDHGQHLRSYLTTPCDADCHDCTSRLGHHFANMACLGVDCLAEQRCDSLAEIYQFYDDHVKHGQQVCHHCHKTGLVLQHKRNGRDLVNYIQQSCPAGHPSCSHSMIKRHTMSCCCGVAKEFKSVQSAINFYEQHRGSGHDTLFHRMGWKPYRGDEIPYHDHKQCLHKYLTDPCPNLHCHLCKSNPDHYYVGSVKCLSCGHWTKCKLLKDMPLFLRKHSGSRCHEFYCCLTDKPGLYVDLDQQTDVQRLKNYMDEICSPACMNCLQAGMQDEAVPRR